MDIIKTSFQEFCEEKVISYKTIKGKAHLFLLPRKVRFRGHRHDHSVLARFMST